MEDRDSCIHCWLGVEGAFGRSERMEYLFRDVQHSGLIRESMI